MVTQPMYPTPGTWSGSPSRRKLAASNPAGVRHWPFPPISYNVRTGLCVVCPITGQAKEYPFEVALPDGLPIRGVVLTDRLKSTDWRSRSAEFIGFAPAEVLADVRAKLKPLLGT